MEDRSESVKEKENQGISRRSFLKMGRGLAISFGLTTVAGGLLAFAKPAYGQYLRPPGAKSEEEFSKRCIRCFQCGQICPVDSIKFLGIDSGLSLDTPYLYDIYNYPCILCMKCTHICPTGALEPVKAEPKDIVAKVSVGKAQIDTEHCPLYLGQMPKCSRCFYSCPIKGEAITINKKGLPEINDKCVGCGVCLKVCPFKTITYI